MNEPQRVVRRRVNVTTTSKGIRHTDITYEVTEPKDSDRPVDVYGEHELFVNELRTFIAMVDAAYPPPEVT